MASDPATTQHPAPSHHKNAVTGNKVRKDAEQKSDSLHEGKNRFI